MGKFSRSFKVDDDSISLQMKGKATENQYSLDSNKRYWHKQENGVTDIYSISRRDLAKNEQ